MSNTPMLVILAGGASSRMWPLKEKSLLRFGEDPLLVSQLRRFESLGFHEAIIVGNPDNQADIQDMIDTMGDGMQVQLAIQPEPTGMGDAILRTEPLLDNPNHAIYINQVHDVVEQSLHTDMLSRCRSNPEAAYLAGVEMDEYFPGGYLIVGEDGRISGMVEKPGPDNRPSNLVNIVAHIHPNAGRLFDTIRAEYARDARSDDHYERAMDTLMKDLPFYVVPYRGRWDALKFPWHTLSIMETFLAQKGLVLGICCHPYDLCTELIARELGVVVTDETGELLRPILNVSADVSWVGYANEAIRAQIEPLLTAALYSRGLIVLQ